MRVDCRHYESRTYASGEIVRKCRLDLAPEAPWRCPNDCAGYEKRRIDVGWQYGSFQASAQSPAPEPDADPAEVAALLDAAEDIVNQAAPDIIAELSARRQRGRFRRRKKR